MAVVYSLNCSFKRDTVSFIIIVPMTLLSSIIGKLSVSLKNSSKTAPSRRMALKKNLLKENVC